MTDLTATAIAPAAQAWLSAAPEARVLNVFDRACNLVDTHGQVLSIVTSERGLTPFAVAITAESAPFRAVHADSSVSATPGHLRLGPLEIDCSAARLWNPSPDWAALRQHLAGLSAALAESAQGHGPAGSLLDLIDLTAPHLPLPFVDGLGVRSDPSPSHTFALCSPFPDREGGRGVRSALAPRLSYGAQQLITGWQSASLETIIAGVKLLAGLGGGLTPAGDDFILGTLLSAWIGLYGAGAERWAAPVAEAAATLTTTLSAAYLRAAARGECSAYWHAVFEAWLHSDRAGLQDAVHALLAVGHTSGADALAGFLGAQVLLAAQPAARPQGDLV